MTDNTSDIKNSNINKYMSTYMNKKYATNTEFRNKHRADCKNRYKRVTINCTSCNIRVKTDKSINGMCSQCNNKMLN